MHSRPVDIARIPPLLALAVLFVALVTLTSAAVAQAPDARVIAASAGFVENTGQWSDRVRFRVVQGAITLWLADDGATIDLSAGPGRGHVLRHRLVGARPCAIEPSLRSPSAFTFLRGDARRTARSYHSVTYRELLPGIDARYRLADGALKYDIVVAAGADPSRVRIRYEGADRIALESDGALRIKTTAGILREAPPVSFQIVDGRRVDVASRFTIDRDGIGIALGAYDRACALVIDPTIALSTYVGGGANDEGRGIDVDAQANVYVGGTTVSSDLPTTPGAYSRQPDRTGSLDMFVLKLDPTGSVILYGTYIGGSGRDELTAIRVGADGAVTLAGTTTSGDFPATPGAFQTALRGSSDGFIARLSPSGSALVAATYFGGGGGERIEDLAINATGSAFVVGGTSSDDLPTTALAFQESSGGGDDAFAARFPPALDAPTYATYIGGAGADHADGIALGSGGAANIAGWTRSDDLPTTAGAAQAARAGGQDVFVARLRFNGRVLEYGTYLGGGGDDLATDIAIDVPGNQYVVGYTSSSDLPVTTADAQGTWFAARIDSSTGSASTGVGYVRYVGPIALGQASTVQAGPGGEAFIAGATLSPTFPTTPDRVVAGPGGGLDLALVRLSADGATIAHASVIGGEQSDESSRQSHLTRFGDLYITGTTSSARFPLSPNALDSTLNNNGLTVRSDAFALAYRFGRRPTIQAPVRIAFDTVGCDTAARDTFEVVNAGEAELVIRANRFASETNRFVLEQPSPVATDIRIAPGGRVRYIVRFRALAPGTVFDTLLVYSNDSLRSPLRIALRGVRSSPDFAGVPASIDFARMAGCTGAAQERTATVANSGNESATLSDARFVRGVAFRLLRPARFPVVVAPGGPGTPFEIRFEPPAAGGYTDTLVLTVAGCAAPLRIVVNGIADSVGFAIVEEELGFPSLESCTGSVDTHVTIRSTGTAEITLATPVAPGSGFTILDPFPLRLLAGESRRVRVRFAPPTGATVAQATLRFESAQCGRVDSVVLHGERRPGAALVVPDSVDFGAVVLCVAGAIDSTLEIALVNSSGLPLAVGAPTITAPFIVDDAGGLPRSLAAGATARIRLRFAPTASGTALDTVVIPIDAGGCLDTVRIAAKGSAARPLLEPADTTIAIPALPECVAADTVVVVLRNASTIAVEIDSIATTDGIEHLAPAIAFTVPAGEPIRLFIRFAPRQSGATLERLTLFTRGCRDSIVVMLEGGKEGSVVVAEPRSLSLAPMLSCALDSTALGTVHIRNSGDFAVRLRSATVAGSGAFTLTAEHAGATIAEGSELPIDLRFEPDRVGPFIGSLVLVLEPCGDTLVVPLEAHVVEARLSVVGAVFGSVGIGTSSPDTVIVVNELPMRVRVGSLESPAAPFSIDGDPSPREILPGDTMRIPVRFAPAIPGPFESTVGIVVDEPCGFVVRAPLTGVATGAVDTVVACIAERAAGLSGDVVELAIATTPHAPIGAGASVEYAVAYDWRRLAFVGVASAGAGATVTALADVGRLRVAVEGGVPFGPEHVLLRFRLLSGTEATTAVRIDSARAIGSPVALAVCADSAVVRIADRCVLTGVTLGRFANRLETSRPHPARDAAEIVFQQLEDAPTLLAIYDLEGRERLRAIDEPLAPGRYAVRVDVSSLPSGTYLVRIRAGSYSEAVRLVVDR